MRANFELKKVYGKKRYYPLNELAFALVELKRAITQQYRKHTVTCLSAKEIKVLFDFNLLDENIQISVLNNATCDALLESGTANGTANGTGTDLPTS